MARSISHTVDQPWSSAEPTTDEAFLSSDQELVLADARAGSPRALRQLYEAHQAQIRSHLFRLLGPDPEIDDLVQTIFARAFSALPTFRGNSPLSTWLYRITTNTTHNLLRQRFRRNRIKSAFSWWTTGRSAHLHDSRPELRDDAQRLLQQLAPDLREVFVFYHYEGLTLQEISQILDKPVSTVGDRLTRARKRLHELVTSDP